MKTKPLELLGLCLVVLSSVSSSRAESQFVRSIERGDQRRADSIAPGRTLRNLIGADMDFPSALIVPPRQVASILVNFNEVDQDSDPAPEPDSKGSLEILPAGTLSLGPEKASVIALGEEGPLVGEDTLLLDNKLAVASPIIQVKKEDAGVPFEPQPAERKSPSALAKSSPLLMRSPPALTLPARAKSPSTIIPEAKPRAVPANVTTGRQVAKRLEIPRSVGNHHTATPDGGAVPPVADSRELQMRVQASRAFARF